MEINTSNNVVQGNYIGTDAGGTLNRGNRLGDGVQLQGITIFFGGAAIAATAIAIAKSNSQTNRM